MHSFNASSRAPAHRTTAAIALVLAAPVLGCSLLLPPDSEQLMTVRLLGGGLIGGSLACCAGVWWRANAEQRHLLRQAKVIAIAAVVLAIALVVQLATGFSLAWGGRGP